MFQRSILRYNSRKLFKLFPSDLLTYNMHHVQDTVLFSDYIAVYARCFNQSAQRTKHRATMKSLSNITIASARQNNYFSTKTKVEKQGRNSHTLRCGFCPWKCQQIRNMPFHGFFSSALFTFLTTMSALVSSYLLSSLSLRSFNLYFELEFHIGFRTNSLTEKDFYFYQCEISCVAIFRRYIFKFYIGWIGTIVYIL